MLEKHRLTTTWATQLWLWGWIGCLWCGFCLPQVLRALLLELLAQSSQAFAAARCKEAEVAHFDEAFG